jgi:hypothetical protein
MDQVLKPTYLPIVPYENNILSFLPTFPNTLNTYSRLTPDYKDEDNVLFQYYDTGVFVFMKQN